MLVEIVSRSSASGLEQVFERSSAQKRMRIAALVGRYRRLNSIVEDRSEDSELRTQPGGDTGLLAKRLKLTPSGEAFTEYVLGAALLRERARIETTIAKELGQVVERREPRKLDVRTEAPQVLLTPEQREAVRGVLVEAQVPR